MAVELVLLAPVLVAFTLLVVAFGRYVAVRGEIEALSRDAVREASLQRTAGEAQAAATATVDAARKPQRTCSAPVLGGDFVPSGIITVTLACDVSYAGLGLIGLPGSTTVRTTSAAPLDTYRRVG
jgi:Flp pilus assembly protein TadG